MRLILLPAFDGTGAMFARLVVALGDAFEPLPIAYPETGPQDYDTLARGISERIVSEREFIVLGESFAGPLAYRIALAAGDRCRGAVFVATYLTNPSPWLLGVLGALPARLSAGFVSRPLVVRLLTLSRAAECTVSREIAANFGSVAPGAIRARLRTIGALNGLPDRKLALPCLYLQATGDRLVPAARLADFEAVCPDLTVARVAGGHFVAQENPRDCARAVREKFG